MCTNSGLQEEGGSVFILLWAVSGHHYLTLQKESCKQMLVAHSAAIVCLAVAEAQARKRGSTDAEVRGMRAGTDCGKC